MYGRVLLAQDRILLAAQAHCPHCGHRFPVSCVITDDKRVHRVIIPMNLLRWWLSTVRQHHVSGEPATQARDWEFHPATTLPEHQHLAMSPPKVTLPDARSDDIIGSFDGKPIPAWVRYQQKMYEFTRVWQQKSGTPLLNEQEILIDEVLIYTLQLHVPRVDAVQSSDTDHHESASVPNSDDKNTPH